MDLSFTLNEHSPDTKTLFKLRTLCSTARSLERLAYSWVTPRRQLVVERNDEVPFHCVAIMFSEDKKLLAHANILTEDLLRICPNFQLLNERTVPTRGGEGYQIDPEWYDARNDRLGILNDNRIDMNKAPATSLSELILSYALSTKGFARVSLEHHGQRKRSLPVVCMDLVYLDKNEERGWCEKIGVYRKELGRCLNRSFI